LIVLRGPPHSWRLPPNIGGVAVSIGVFDGVHRGHQSLLAGLVAAAAERSLTPAVATFEPHPLRVLAPHRAPQMITSVAHRVEILQQLGVEMVGVMPFAEIQEMEADRFIADVLVERLNTELVLVGENFQFGKGGKGSPQTLRQAGERYGFVVKVTELLGGETPITSSRVRQCVAEGETAEAARLLGRPFEIQGKVAEGDRRGRQLGIPTANLETPSHMCIPPNGIYAAWAEVEAGTHPAALNIGVRPTFGEGRLITEAHLLDFSGDLYGSRMRLRLVGDRIRPEIAYSSVDQLMAQVKLDIAEVRRRLNTG